MALCLREEKIDCLLNGISTADFQINVRLSPVVYFAVKSFLLVAVCVFYIFFFVVVVLLFFRFFMCVCSILTCIFVFKKFNVNSVYFLDEPFRLLEQMLQ